MNSIVSKEDFAQLVRQHAAAVIDFTARLLPDRREAEEVAQDAFVKAFRNLSSFRGESSLLTWVQRIAYHKAVDHLRQQRPYMVAIDEVPTLLEDEEMVMEREERILLIEEAVDRLTPDDQLLLHASGRHDCHAGSGQHAVLLFKWQVTGSPSGGQRPF